MPPPLPTSPDSDSPTDVAAVPPELPEVRRPNFPPADTEVRGRRLAPPMMEADAVRSEAAGGGEDVRSSDACSAAADHLVVMVHGILGCGTDWKFAAEQFDRNLPDKIIVHCSESNSSRLTLDGVDVMGERLSQEVCKVIGRNLQLKKISFVAHSVGGLVARYAIGILYKPSGGVTLDHESSDASNKDCLATIAGLEPINFITVATPHLGSRGNGQVPFLFGVTAFEKAASRVIHWIFGTTGKHLFLTDGENREHPLLQRMVYDCGNLHFMSALASFKRRVVYSNVGFDHIVGWRTSSIRRKSELPKWEDNVNERYPHVVFEERTKGSIDEGDEQSLSEDGSDMLEEILLRGLSRLSWEKVDVSFHTSRQRFAAHSIIQVKDSWAHSEGADIIQHMIDHLLL